MKKDHLTKFEQRWKGRELTDQMLASLDAWDAIHRPLRSVPVAERDVESLLEMEKVPEERRDHFYWDERRKQFRRVENRANAHKMVGTYLVTNNGPNRKQRRANPPKFNLAPMLGDVIHD